ncbi:MAG: hypothetical protein V1838_04535 [Patescibacteria group bacterium]
MPILQIHKKTAPPPPGLEPERELPAAPKEELLEEGDQPKHKGKDRSSLITTVSVLLIILILALLAIIIM